MEDFNKKNLKKIFFLQSFIFLQSYFLQIIYNIYIIYEIECEKASLPASVLPLPSYGSPCG